METSPLAAKGSLQALAAKVERLARAPRSGLGPASGFVVLEMPREAAESMSAALDLLLMMPASWSVPTA